MITLISLPLSQKTAFMQEARPDLQPVLPLLHPVSIIEAILVRITLVIRVVSVISITAVLIGPDFSYAKGE